MFEHHKKSPWFAEKYDPSPEYVNLRKRVRKEGWKGRLNAFLFDLESGRFDPDFQEHIPAEAPPSPVKENATVKKDDIPKKEEKDVKPEDADSDMAPAVPVADDSMKMDEEVNLGNDDEGDENDGGKSNGRARQDGREKNRGEEISVHSEGHQVMIRTIPPDIGRVKLETVGVCIFTRLQYLIRYSRVVLCRLLTGSRDMSTSLLETLCRRGITIGLDGSNSVRTLT